MPIITINDKQIEVEKGLNVIQAAQKIGIEIPHYCYHPGLRIDGNCRMCLVEVKGPRGFMPQIACNTLCTDGLEVKTDTEQVKNMRQGVMEFLLHNHPIDCPICDQAGECRLQDYYMKYGKYDNRSIVEKEHKDKVLDVGPTVVLDQERCVLCSRCVRFCEDVSKTNELVIFNRGVKSRLGLFPGSKLENNYSGNVVDICPVGALTSKDFRFKMRVWFMSTAKSVCQGCSRGCNILADYKVPDVYRFRPRPNTEVNNYWICDEGRFSYKKIKENRFLEALENNEQIDYDLAVENFSKKVKNTKSRYTPKSILAIASPESTLEDNFMLRKFMKDVVGSDKVLGVSFKPEGFEDDLLIKADKTPNKKGLEYLGIDFSEKALIEELEKKEVKLLIVMNNDILEHAEEKLSKLLEGVEIVSLSPYNTKTVKKSTLAIPVSLYSEKYGSIVNFNSQLQKFEKAIDTFELDDSLAVAEWEFFGKLIESFNGNTYQDIEDVWKELSTEVSALSNLTFYDIPDTGINLVKKVEKEQELKAQEEAEKEAVQEAKNA
ncbi:MAG: 2Fe-2S iron-sulfur cluster-binding protein [Candidatus Sericytochromatia bacterium]